MWETLFISIKSNETVPLYSKDKITIIFVNSGHLSLTSDETSHVISISPPETPDLFLVAPGVHVTLGHAMGKNSLWIHKIGLCTTKHHDGIRKAQVNRSYKNDIDGIIKISLSERMKDAYFRARPFSSISPFDNSLVCFYSIKENEDDIVTNIDTLDCSHLLCVKSGCAVVRIDGVVATRICNEPCSSSKMKRQKRSNCFYWIPPDVSFTVENAVCMDHGYTTTKNSDGISNKLNTEPLELYHFIFASDSR